jgi:hypothetical protein
MLLPDRTVCVPEWVEASAREAASAFASQFDKDHRILIHELIKLARASIRPDCTQAFGVTISEPPTLSERGELVFRMVFDDAELILHVSSWLTPSQLHLTEDVRCDSERLFATLDVALEYMQAHVDDIEGIGFDTTVLRMNMREWKAYRERMRVIKSPERDTRGESTT